jgi:hypothetical protein
MIGPMRYLPLLLLALAGCSSSWNPVGPSVSQTVANGQPAYEFHCGGWFDTRTSCNLKASEMCPYGYYPLDASEGRLVAACAAAPAAGVRRPS